MKQSFQSIALNDYLVFSGFFDILFIGLIDQHKKNKNVIL